LAVHYSELIHPVGEVTCKKDLTMDPTFCNGCDSFEGLFFFS